MTLDEARQDPRFAGMSDSDLRSLGFDPGYKSPELLAYNKMVEDAAGVYKEAYQRWQEANPGANPATYNPKKYLPKGYKPPKQPKVLTGEWFSQFGDVIPDLQTRMVNYNEQLANYKPTIAGNPFGLNFGGARTGSFNPAAQIPPSVVANTNQQQANTNLQTGGIPGSLANDTITYEKGKPSVLGSFQSQGGLLGQAAIAAEDTGKTPSWMDNIYNTGKSGSTIPSWKQLYG